MAPGSVLIVGASLAGHATARALRRAGFDGSLTLLGAEPARPYDRPPLSKDFLAGAATAADLALEPDGEDLGAAWLLGVPAVALQGRTRTVTLAGGGTLRADAVVIATGSRARRMPDAPAGVHALRTLTDAEALRAELLPGARLVVIGAGFIGSEVAATASRRGLSVTVLEAAATPLAGPLGTAMGRAVGALHAANGVTLRCGMPVTGLTGSDRVTGVMLADGSVIPADVVLTGIGADPAVAWLDGSGLATAGGLACDAVGRTAVPGVFGVGDCSAWFDPVLGSHRRIEHWTDSRDRPAVAVAALLGGPDAQVAPPARAPYFWSDQYGVRIQFAGRHSADDEVTVESGSAEGFDLLAVYRQAGSPVAVLGMNQVGPFNRWRRALSTPPPAGTRPLTAPSATAQSARPLPIDDFVA